MLLPFLAAHSQLSLPAPWGAARPRASPSELPRLPCSARSAPPTALSRLHEWPRSAGRHHRRLQTPFAMPRASIASSTVRRTPCPAMRPHSSPRPPARARMSDNEATQWPLGKGERSVRAAPCGPRPVDRRAAGQRVVDPTGPRTDAIEQCGIGAWGGPASQPSLYRRRRRRRIGRAAGAAAPHPDGLGPCRHSSHPWRFGRLAMPMTLRSESLRVHGGVARLVTVRRQQRPHCQAAQPRPPNPVDDRLVCACVCARMRARARACLRASTNVDVCVYLYTQTTAGAEDTRRVPTKFNKLPASSPGQKYPHTPAPRASLCRARRRASTPHRSPTT